MFKRKQGNDDDSTNDDQVEVAAVSEDDDKAASAAPTEGPWDINELPATDEIVRIDFGALKVPGVDGMEISLEVEEESQRVIAITIGIGEGAIQLQPFAAPRGAAFWPEVIDELRQGITANGGKVEESDGKFGIELRTEVPVTDEEGATVIQQARFIAVEGPRWVLRGVLLGKAFDDPIAAEVLEDVFRGCVVDRGQQPMAPGDLLQLQLPEGAVEEAVEAAEEEVSPNGRAPLDPFERGPEITEIR